MIFLPQSPKFGNDRKKSSCLHRVLLSSPCRENGIQQRFLLGPCVFDLVNCIKVPGLLSRVVNGHAGPSFGLCPLGLFLSDQRAEKQ